LQLGGLLQQQTILFHKTKDPIDRNSKIVQVWKKPKEWKINTQRKSLGKTRNKDEEDEQRLFPKSLFFYFPNPRKTPNQM